MKVVAIVDKPGSAIHRLALMNAERLPHLRYTVCTLHPKRPSEQETAKIEHELKDADMIDVQYWKSGIVALQRLPFADSLPRILTHHNEHNIHDTDKDHWSWKDYEWTAHVCKNGWQKSALKKEGISAHLIPHAAEFSNLSFAPKMPEERLVGYVGQIKKVKGVREIAEACRRLEYKLLIVGSVSESEYARELMRKYEDTIQTFYPGSFYVPDEQIRFAYERMRVYCANSDDGTESGTMPIIEAMVSGVPIVTRNIGLVRDSGEHGKNMFIRKGRYDDVDELEKSLKMVMENDDIACDMRENAWRTARQYHPDRQAREYERLFRKALEPSAPLVSIIMPTCGRNETIVKNIQSLQEQTYRNFEVVVCDDNTIRDSSELLSALKSLRCSVRFPIRHVWTIKKEPGYQLAKARNMGIIEAAGDILVFCDDRLKMHPDAILAFVKRLTANDNKPAKKWLWGSKGKFKTFVENFSCAWRRSIIDAGMFSERMDGYGGMTQEISGRYGAQGFTFDFCPQAACEPMLSTHSKSRHREEIIKSKIKLYKMGFQ